MGSAVNSIVVTLYGDPVPLMKGREGMLSDGTVPCFNNMYSDADE